MAKIKARRGGNAPPSVTERKTASVFSTLEDIISENRSPVDIKNFAYLFMDKIGGPQGFVDRVMEEFEGSQVGSLSRARVLEIMMKLFQLATPKETYGDYSDMTEDDLKAVVTRHMIAPPSPTQWIDHVCI